jgi:hypothetical protein
MKSLQGYAPFIFINKFFIQILYNKNTFIKYSKIIKETLETDSMKYIKLNL